MLRVVVAALPVLVAGCLDAPPVPPRGSPVFYDGFTAGFTPSPFDGSVTSSLSVDRSTTHQGTSSIKFDVPSIRSGYTGGAVLASTAQDLSGANALVFWTIASTNASFDKLGFGLNFYFPSTYQATLFDLPLTTEWTRHRIPIPNPDKLTAEHGMLWYGEVQALNYQAWFNDVRFEFVNPADLDLQPSVVTDSVTLGIDGTSAVGLKLQYADFDGTLRFVDSLEAAESGPAPAYFTFSSSNPSVATVDGTGRIIGVRLGQASISAALRGLPVPGSISVEVVSAPPAAPETPAPVPTAQSFDVVSLYTSSHIYPSAPVDTWQTGWSAAGPASTFSIPGGSVVKKYTALRYAGLEFLAPGPRLNVSAMTTMHLDLWTPNGTAFMVKLKGFTGGTPGPEATVAYLSSKIKQNRWISLEIPLSKFTGVDLSNIGQIVLVNTDPGAANNAATTGTYFIDNVYFHR
jgi:hypothetical protein